MVTLHSNSVQIHKPADALYPPVFLHSEHCNPGCTSWGCKRDLGIPAYFYIGNCTIQKLIDKQIRAWIAQQQIQILNFNKY